MRVIYILNYNKYCNSVINEKSSLQIRYPMPIEIEYVTSIYIAHFKWQNK
jgi:hypothetical protein